MRNDLYLEKANRLKEQGKIKESLNAYYKSIDLASSTSYSDAKHITKVIKQAASIATINHTPYKKIVFYTGLGGLCNRLRALCSYLYLSHHLDIPLLMCWYPNEACDCYFDELFEDVCEMISPQTILRIFNSQESSNILYVDVGKWKRIYETYWQQHLDYETYWQGYLKFIRQMPLKKSILKKIDIFIEKFWHEDIIGLHIRRTDLLEHLKSRKLESDYSSNEKFISSIEQAIADGYSCFFLATDEVSTKTLIQANFPEKIISYCQTFDSFQKRQTFVEDALIDLYLLSKCTKIIGSYHSSFSRYAANLGNIPLTYP
ncbi:MAG: hypothetical protein AAF572_12220 [Cyanobacteria bacterium P01_B01_bin.77]